MCMIYLQCYLFNSENGGFNCFKAIFNSRNIYYCADELYCAAKKMNHSHSKEDTAEVKKDWLSVIAVCPKQS